MVPERSSRPVHPAVRAGKFVCLIEGVTNTIIVARTLADHHQPDFILRIVDEGVAYSSACRKRDGITFSNGMKLAVDPYVGLACEHVHKLLLGTLGIRI